MYKIFTAFICRIYSCVSPKFLLVMKLTLVLLITALVQVNAASYAQRVSLKVKNQALEEIITQLRKQTGYDFLYSSEVLKDSKAITLTVVNAPLEEVLKQCFIDQPFTFTIDKKIVVIKKGIPSRAPVRKNISGKVTDDKGEPLVGVNIKVKGTERGSTSDVNGDFKLEADKGDILVFTYLGFVKLEVKVEDKSNVSVVMTPDAAKLNEVVVVGYGTARKVDLTTSISTISSEDIMKTPITSLEQALQGNASGVLVTNTSGEPGGEISIRVRGGSSIKADNEPLLVIDGFTTDQGFSSLNPSDIKSIEVLKDAGATAIYGSRGANGVILVTTKAGQKGKPKVSVETYYGFQSLRRKLPLLNAAELAQLANEAKEAIGSSPNTLRPDTIPTNRDWQELLFRTAPQINNTISITGGDDKIKYYVSGNYISQEGLIVSSNYSRASLRSNLDFNFNKAVSAGVKLNLSQMAKRGIEVGDNGSILRANAANPYKTGLVDPSGSFIIDPETGDPISNTELARAQELIDKNKNGSIQAGGYLKINILKNLSLRSAGTYNPSNKLSDYFLPNTIKGDKVSIASEQLSRGSKWSNDNTLTYNNQIEKHSFTLLAGQEMTNSFSNTFKASGSDYATDAFGYYNLGSGNGIATISSSATKYNLLSFFGRATYNYNNRYLFAFTYRADGSSKFGENNKWGYFPSASFAWRASKESFIKDLNVFDELKIRATYGVNGSDRISAYSSQALYGTIATAIGNAAGVGTVINKMANKDLRWEKTAEYDLGIDIAILKGKLSFTADYYEKNTSDLLLDFSLPATSGYTTVSKNVGSVSNKGFEFDLTSRNITGKFNWTTSLNAAINRNTVTDLGGLTEIPAISNSSQNTKFGNVVLIKEGEPLGVFFGHRVAGVFQNQAEVDAGAKVPGTTTLPGFFKYVDTNIDGMITDADKVILGNPQPDWNGGITNTFSFKNIDLSVFAVFQQGNSILNTSGTKLMDLSGDNNQLDIVRDRWRAPNPETGDPGHPSNTIQRAYKGYPALMSDFYVEDGSYVRIKTLTLAYNLPKPILNKVKVSGLKLYVSGTNLFTFTDYYGGYDPEVSIQGKNGVGAGLDNGSYPTSKMFVFGLNANF